MTTYPLSSTGDRLGLMLFIAAGLHLLLILGVSFEFNKKNKERTQQKSLDVILVEHSKEPPKPQEKAEFLAQASQSGGGEKTPESRPTPASATSLPPIPPAPIRQQSEPPKPQPLPKQVITQAQSKHQAPAHTQTLAEPVPVKPTASQLLASRDREIVRLTAELERKRQAYANRPRRKSINASTKEYTYAAYLDAWRRKVERVGNLNYPDEAKRQKLYGNMILHVAVKSDGSVEQVRVLRSSGYKILDDAAVRIVWLAAPYSPFPQEINQETDILDITRTWQFTRSNQLGTE